MLIPISYLVGGLIGLLFAAEMLVRGSVAAAEKLNVPPLLIGLTIVAFGTSAPELVISAQAALTGFPGVAIGNVVGSNIANIFLVLGVPALIYPIESSQAMIRRNVVIMLLATGLFVWLAIEYGAYIHWHGQLLFGCIVLFLLYSGFRATIGGKADPTVEDLTNFEELGARPKSNALITVLLLVGLIGLPIAGHLMVVGAEAMATHLGVPDTVIALSLIAFGTSLPELATVVVAATHRQSAVIFGSVIGSNLFNILAVMGVAAMLAPIGVPESFLRFDMWVMVAAALAIVPFVFLRRPLGRLTGLIFVSIYALYIYSNYQM